MAKQQATESKQHQDYVVQRLRDLINEIETGECLIDDFKDALDAKGINNLHVVTIYKK